VNADETFRRLFEAGLERDVDRVLELTHEDVVFVGVAFLSDAGGVYRGHEGMRQLIESLDGFEGLSVEISETRELGNGLFVAGRLKTTELDIPLWWVIAFEGGKVRRIDEFTNEIHALQAAGER
jgi:ketosteroid isomerase-like protein